MSGISASRRAWMMPPSILVVISGFVLVMMMRKGMTRPSSASSSSLMRFTARPASLESRALACSGMSTRSACVMARDTRRFAVPSRSTRTNWRTALCSRITRMMLLSVTSPTTSTVEVDSPDLQRRMGLFGSASMIVTEAPIASNACARTRVIVLFPAPPFELAVTMTGINPPVC